MRKKLVAIIEPQVLLVQDDEEEYFADRILWLHELNEDGTVGAPHRIPPSWPDNIDAEELEARGIEVREFHGNGEH